MTALACAELHELAPEAALGLLDGAERAAVLAHVERCRACRAELASLTEVGEHLLLLAPEAQPAPGFESRVLEKVGPDRSRRRRRLLVGLAAAAVVVVTALAAGAVARLSDGDATHQPVETAMADLRNDDGAVIAQARYRRSDPAVVEIDMGEWIDKLVEHGVDLDGEWWLVVRDGTGQRHLYDLPMRAFVEVEMNHGPGAPIAQSVAIADENGRVWCQGAFS